ncbi:glycoside hydrolase domain-containing protein, partial [Streptococcus sp. E29BA]
MIVEAQVADTTSNNSLTSEEITPRQTADYSAVFEVLQKAVNELLKADAYTPESLAYLDQVVNQIVFDKPASEQAEVDAYITVINDAIVKLQPINTETSDEKANYTAVLPLVERANVELLKTDVYTEESLNQLKAALASIRLNHPVSEQEFVDSYVLVLTAALQALQPKESPVKPRTESQKEVILATAETAEDESGKIKYSGDWFDYPDNVKVLFGGDSPSATLRFNGDQVHVFGDKAPYNGQVDVFLDGSKVASFSAYGDDDEDPANQNQLLYTTPSLLSGNHVIKLVPAQDTSFYLRRFEVHSTVEVTSEERVNLEAHLVSNGHHYKQTDYDQLRTNIPSRSERPFAFRNDQINAEVLLLAANHDLEEVTGTASDFMTTGGIISSDKVKIRFLRETSAHIARGGDKFRIPDAPREMVPDIIDKAGSVTIPARSLKGSWVTIDVPEDAKAGVYTGSLTYKAANAEEAIVVPYSFEVLPFEQPKTDRFSVELWQYPYTVARYYGLSDEQLFGEEHLAILRQQLSEYQKVGGKSITATVVEDPWNNQTYDKYPSMVKWTKKEDGSFTFNFDHFDKYVSLAMELGIDQQIKSFSIAPWDNRVGYFDEAQNRPRSQRLTPGSQQWKETWGAFLPAYIAHLDEKGWFDKAYIALDERPADVMKEVLDLLSKYRNKDGKTLKLSVAIDHYEPAMKELLDKIDDISVSMTEIDNPARQSSPELLRSYAKERRERGQTTTMYSMVGQYPNAFTRSAPVEAAWVLLYAHSLGLDGYLRWAYDAWVKEPLETVDHWWWESGDPFLIYPGDKTGSDKTPRTSPRYEQIKEAERLIEKIRWIKATVPEAGEELDHFVLNMRRPEGRRNRYGAMESTGVNQERQVEADVRAVFNKVREVISKYKSQLLAQTISQEQPSEQNQKPMTVFSLDAGRKYFNLDSLKELVDTLSQIGYTDLHLILGNDGLRFFLDDMSLSANGQTYSNEAVKEALRRGNLAYEQSKRSRDNAQVLTQSELDSLFAYAQSKNIRIIPTINSPGHMDAIVTAIEELGIADAKFKHDGKTSLTTLNLNNDFAVNFTKALIDKYASYFSGKSSIFNIGLDEYANDITKPKFGFKTLQERGEYDKFVSYANDLAAIVKSHQLVPMAFNDGIYHNNVTTAGTFDKDIIVSYWTIGWGEGDNRYNVATPNFLYEKGHKLLNTNDDWYYVIGRNRNGQGWYNLDQGKGGIQRTPYTKLQGDTTGTVPVIGAMVAAWADEPRMSYRAELVNELLVAFADRNPDVFNANYKQFDEALNLASHYLDRLPVSVQEALTELLTSISRDKTRNQQVEVDIATEKIKQLLLPYLPQEALPAAWLDMKIVSLDAGRKYFSPEIIKSVIDKISELGFTDLHLLLGNDGLRFVLDDMTLEVNNQVYASDAVKAAIKNGNKVYYDDPNGNALTESEMLDILTYAASRRINIIPTINSPGHMDTILEAMASLGIANPKYSFGGKLSKTTIDLTNQEAVDFTKALIKKYVDFFAGKVGIFNIGLDEYANDATNARGFYRLQADGHYDKFIIYANDLSSIVKSAGLKPMAFNDGVYYNNHTASGSFDKDLLISYWTSGWSGYDVAKPAFFNKKGHHLINTNDAWYYVLGRDDQGGYNLASALERIGRTPINQVPGTTAGSVPTIGSMVAIWADNPSAVFEKEKFDRLVTAFAEANATHLRANYLPLLEVLNQLPQDLSKGYYTDESYTGLVNAVSAIDWQKKRHQQSEVDAYLTSVKQAIEGLTYKPADYSRLQELLLSIPEDLTMYTDESLVALESAISAIQLDKKASDQAIVDGYISTITEALAKLEKKQQVAEEDQLPEKPSDEQNGSTDTNEGDNAGTDVDGNTGADQGGSTDTNAGGNTDINEGGNTDVNQGDSGNQSGDAGQDSGATDDSAGTTPAPGDDQNNG